MNACSLGSLRSDQCPNRATTRIYKTIPPALQGVGGLAGFFFHLPSSPSGRGLPLPLPPPLDLDGGFREALERPMWLQEGLREPMASKIAQDSPTLLKIANNMPPSSPKRATRRSQVLLETPQDLPEKPKSFKNLKENQWFLPSRPFASDALLRPQDGPRELQEGPKRPPNMAPRPFKIAPRGAQERPKR